MFNLEKNFCMSTCFRKLMTICERNLLSLKTYPLVHKHDEIQATASSNIPLSVCHHSVVL